MNLTPEDACVIIDLMKEGTVIHCQITSITIEDGYITLTPIDGILAGEEFTENFVIQEDDPDIF